MTATQLAQNLMDLAAEAGYDPPVVVGPDKDCRFVIGIGRFDMLSNGRLLMPDDDFSQPSKEVIHVY